MTNRTLDATSLAKRILILDGAMGTMIQRHRLTEADFRGERFAGHPRDLQGQQRSARPDAARRHRRHPSRSISRPAATSSRPTRSTAPPSPRPTTALESLRLRAERRRRAGWRSAAADEWTARTPDRPRFVAGSMGPTNRILSISPDVNNPAFRNMTFDELREAFKEQVRGLIDGGCDLLLLETIVDTLNAKAGIVAIEEVFEEKGVRAAADDLGRRSPIAAAARCRGRRSTRSGCRSRTPGRSASASTARSARATCGRTSRSSRGSPTATSAAIRTPGCPTRSASTTSSRPTPRGYLGEFADERVREHRRRLLRHDAGSHRGDRGGGRGRAAADRFTQVAGHGGTSSSRVGVSRSSPASRRSRSAPTRNFQMIGERTNVTGSAALRPAHPRRQLRRGGAASRSIRCAAART